MKSGAANLGLISCFGGHGTGEIFLSSLVRILCPLGDSLHVIAQNTTQADRGNIHFHRVKYVIGDNIFTQVLNQVVFQLEVACRLLRLVGKVKLWIFYGGEHLLLPMLVVKLFGGRVGLLLAGSLEKESAFKGNILYGLQILLKKINLSLADRIIVYATALIPQWNLGKIRQSKVTIADRHFVDSSLFKIEIPLEERDNLVGYIGRLNQEKGVENFMEAISLLDGNSGLKFLIVGDGPLRPLVENYQHNNGELSFVGWVAHDELPHYLNRLRLLVLPSFTEGMPNIVLEAMACGTPVLTMAVGALSSLIEDGCNGFIMANNSPLCLAESTLRAVNCPELNDIALKAQQLISQEYSFEAAAARFQKVIMELCSDGTC